MSNLTFGVNANNDFYLGGDGNLVMLSGIDALQQDCVQAMKAQYGEMILQPLDGLPNLTDVWINQNLIKWEAAARKTLLARNGVTAIASFTYTISGEVLTYKAILQTVYSQSIMVSEAITSPGLNAS